MAVDKLVDSAQLDSNLEDIADAIRAKSGGSSPLAFPAGFVSEIGSIQTGGGGEKTLAKILDVDVAEAVKIILVPEITEAIKNCESLYFLYSNVTLSESDWLTLIVNGTNYYTQNRSTTYASGVGRLCVSKPVTINGVTIVGEAALRDLKINIMPENFNNGIVSLGVSTYTGNADITSGHFEIWGWC